MKRRVCKTKNRGQQPENLTGKKFGKLTCIEDTGKMGRSTSHFWKCKCECGNFHLASAQHLKLGQVKKCRNCPRKSEKQLLSEAKQRFQSNFEKHDSGCWIWNGNIIRNYGVMFYKKNIRAHRFSYLIHKGPLIDGMLICHTCDNPLCVNPKHLYQGTTLENARDAVERKRYKIGEQHHKSKLTSEDVKFILESEMSGIELGIHFGVHKATIYRIRKGESWRNLT